MKKVLVTGGYGLLGISLVNFILKKNIKVVILDYKKYSKKKSFFLKSKNLIIEKGNFVNYSNLLKIFKKHKFDGIFHLGAQTQVLKAYYLRFGFLSLIPFLLRYFRKLMTLF